jgi:hypothetical protein
VVGDFSGWIRGAFQKYVELPPGFYRLEEGDCVIEPPRYPWHFPTPYIAADWGDVVELRIYAPETPEVSGGEVTKLAHVGPFAVYLGTTRRRRYEVRCCGKTRRFRSSQAVASPLVTAMYEVLPDRAADRLGYRDLRRHLCGGHVKRRGGARRGRSRLFRRPLSTPHISRHELPSIRRGEPHGRRREAGRLGSIRRVARCVEESRHEACVGRSVVPRGASEPVVSGGPLHLKESRAGASSQRDGSQTAAGPL